MTATRSRFALGLGLGLLGVLVFVVVPGDSLASSFVYQGVALAAIVVLGAATWRMPPASRPVWWAVLGYAVLTDLGDIVYDIEAYTVDEAPFPGAADVLYLSAYVAAITALALLIHRVHRGRDLEAWIDTAILTVAATAVIGMVIIGPTLEGSEETVLAQGVSVAYAVFDLLLLSGLTRVLVGSGPINASVALLSGAFGVTLVADLLFSYVAVQGLDDSVPAALDALYLVAFILMAAAANAPAPPHRRQTTRPTTPRVPCVPLRSPWARSPCPSCSRCTLRMWARESEGCSRRRSSPSSSCCSSCGESACCSASCSARPSSCRPWRGRMH